MHRDHARQFERQMNSEIAVGETFSVVELPEPLVERVLEAMQDAPIRGRLVPVRRFRER